MGSIASGRRVGRETGNRQRITLEERHSSMDIAKGVTEHGFRVGQVFRMSDYEITEAGIREFARVSGDANPLHTDDNLAHEVGFKGHIAHGTHTECAASKLFGSLPGAVYLDKHLRFVAPVRPGDMLTVFVKVVSYDPEKEIVAFHVETVKHYYASLKDDREIKPVIIGEEALLVRGVLDRLRNKGNGTSKHLAGVHRDALPTHAEAFEDVLTHSGATANGAITLMAAPLDSVLRTNLAMAEAGTKYVAGLQRMWMEAMFTLARH